MAAILLSTSAQAAEIASKGYVDDQFGPLKSKVDTIDGSYLSTQTASNTYLTQLNAQNTYITIDQAAGDIAKAVGDAVELVNGDVDNKADKVTGSVAEDTLAGLTTEGNLKDSGIAKATILTLGNDVAGLKQNKENASNKAAAIDSQTQDDTHYPTVKLIVTELAKKADTSTTYTKTEVNDELAKKADMAGAALTPNNLLKTDALGKITVAGAVGALATLDTVDSTQITDGSVTLVKLGTNVTDLLDDKEDASNKVVATKFAANATDDAKYPTVKAVAGYVETYAIPKPASYCMNSGAQCVLAVNPLDNKIYWEDVAMGTAPQL
jgi:hypothetical protein